MTNDRLSTLLTQHESIRSFVQRPLTGVRLFLWILVLLTSMQAASEGSNAEQDSSPLQQSEDSRVGMLDAEQKSQQALSQEVQTDKLIWLEVQYPEQEGLINVLALEEKPRSPSVQGAVLLLHDKEQHADWPYVVRSLRLSLPDSGWYTLSVNLPYDDLQPVPERTLMAKTNEQVVLNDALKQALMKRTSRETAVEEKSASQDEEPPAGEAEVSLAETTDTISSQEMVDIDLADKSTNTRQTLPYRDRAEIHIQAAIDHIRKEGYQNIVLIGYRAGADLALDHIKAIAQQLPEQGFALVMIDPILQQSYQHDIAQALGRDFSAPVLDVVSGADLNGREAAAKRESSAHMANALSYQQVRLIASESNIFQQSLLRRVRFWLRKYAPGMSVTKATTRR